MYIGVYKLGLRAKNRIAFPARLKKETGEKLTITNWFENSLMVLPTKDWEETVKDVFENTSFLTQEGRDFDRFIYGGSFEVELDLEGRFVLPAYLKEYAQIKNEIVITGGMWYMQIWDRQVFESYRDLNRIQIKDTAIKVYQNTKQQKQSHE